MVRGFEYIDYDKESFIKESFLIMYYTKGGISYEKLQDLPFDEFLMFVDEAVRIQNKLNEEDDG